ncbi:GNAT family N-acetyltransferase [Singulisphaera sp. PoT]|uniref:GNAT family N-acetyltransferase n=1 Tax=Singulisphaera sp. PoT TaxID=3411797 RepID=UPI003BF4D80F
MIDVSPVALEVVLGFRELYRQEMNCQIIHDSLPRRGFGNLFQFRIDGRAVGHGFVMGYQGEPKDLVREFYVLPAYRGAALKLFRRLVETSKATRIEVQTNDVLLTMMFYDHATEVVSERMLFRDALTTNLAVPGVIFRRATDADKQRIFDDQADSVGDWLLECGEAIVATGGFLTHYNPPYADIYMNVSSTHRRRGYGSYFVQELKRACYEAGHIPAARCDVSNTGSRSTLEKAGLLPCARVLLGVLAGFETRRFVSDVDQAGIAEGPSRGA